MLQRITTNVAAQAWSLALALGDRIVVVGILLRAWGAETYADWATIFAVAGLISLGEFGLNIYFGNAWQLAYAHHKEHKFQRALDLSLAIFPVVAAVLSALAVIFALAGGIDAAFSPEQLDANSSLLVFAFLVAANVLQVLLGSISQIYRGRGKFALGALMNSVVTALTIALAASAGLAGAPPTVVAFVYLVAVVVGGCAILLSIMAHFPHLQFRFKWPALSDVRGILNHARWYGLLQGTPLVWLHAPVLIIAGLGLGGSTLVSFVVARTLVNFARQTTEILARAVSVETINAFHIGDINQVSRVVPSASMFFSAWAGALAGGLMLFGNPFMAFWTGNSELFNPWIIFWFLVPFALTTPALPLKNILIFGNLPRPVGLASLVQLVVGLPLCYGLANTWGISGAAAGLGAGEALAFGLLLPVLGRQHVHVAYGRHLLTGSIVFLLAALWSGLAARSLLAVIGADSFSLFLASGTLWGFVGLVPAMILATPKRQRVRLSIMGLHWVRSSRGRQR